MRVLPGMAHTSHIPFNRAGFWGSAWRPQREFVGRVNYAIRWLLHNPVAATHARFPADFRDMVRTVLLCARAPASGGLHALPEEAVHYIVNMCRYDWATPAAAGDAAARAAVADGASEEEEEEEEEEDFDEDDEDDEEEGERDGARAGAAAAAAGGEEDDLERVVGEYAEYYSHVRRDAFGSVVYSGPITAQSAPVFARDRASEEDARRRYVSAAAELEGGLEVDD